LSYQETSFAKVPSMTLVRTPRAATAGPRRSWLEGGWQVVFFSTHCGFDPHWAEISVAAGMQVAGE